MRHSRRVRFLRIAIPVAAAVAIGGAALVAWINPFSLFAGVPIRIGDVVMSGTKIKMEQPRLSGFTRDSRAYDLSARAAAQDITHPNLVELTDLHAKLQLHDHSTVELSAAKGLFDTKAEVLKLDHNILVRSSAGYEGRLSQAVVDTRSGNVVSHKPVALKIFNTTIKANGLEIEHAGDMVRFTGGVVTTLMPNKDRPATAAEKQ